MADPASMGASVQERRRFRPPQEARGSHAPRGASFGPALGVSSDRVRFVPEDERTGNAWQVLRQVNAEEGIRLLFTNDFQKAEETFREGSQRERPRIRPANDSTRDTRGVFALIYTMVSFMFGLLSFANDQLDECLTRVWTAESLLLEDAPWVGQKMLLGMVYLIAGVVQAAKNAWLKSGVNLVRSLRYIKDFEEGLHFSGREAHFVRSFAGFVMGLFNLVLSMLPPQMLRVASRAGGRTLQGSRTDALELLHQCYVQDGIMAPFAVLVLLCYNIWIKTYLGEAITDEDFAASKGFLQWASERYPSSAVFEFWQAELHVIRTEVREASECVERVHSVLAHLKLPAIDSFLEQKKAMFSLALLEWPEAASGFEESLAVSVARQRRSYVPTLSYLAGLCRVVSGQAAEARPNFERVQQYSKMRKRNWPPEDDLAFAKVKEFGPSSCTTPRRALLELVEISMLKIHVLHTMPGEEKRRLKEKLLEEHEGEAAEEAARGLLFAAEISRLQGAFEEARRFGAQAQQLLPKLGPRGQSNGTAAALHLTLALLGVDGHLTALDKCPRCCRAYDEAIKFKRLGLERRIADGANDAPEELPGDRSVENGSVEGGSVEGDDEEFFSAEEEEHEDAQPSSWKAHFWKKWKFRRPPSIETELGSDDVKPAAASPSSSLSWASEVAVKALRDFAKKSAVAGGQLGHQASEQLGHLANSGLWALRSQSGRRAGACGSSKLHLEALLRQADQGDCSVVSMSTPGPGVSEADVVAYLRWVPNSQHIRGRVGGGFGTLKGEPAGDGGFRTWRPPVVERFIEK
ncbi:Tetratricopeptide repeat protein 39A (TPR repeat protein 39A) [Durusdinium trenchii]|uniref:Tetratricopeptide repeat protein 39A (TPR repeat protein 39A) n=1 Tax=Durusdinium trenchii TaxID=1381693 RepID=A0ABP0KAN7_9DINO